MASPIKLDGTAFSMKERPVRRFIDIGTQRNSRGTTHTLYLCKVPVHPEFFVGEQHPINGYCSYRLLYNSSDSFTVGVILLSAASRTASSDYTFIIGGASVDDVDTFDPSFILEKSIGLLIFKARDSSLLIVPETISSTFVIKTA